MSWTQLPITFGDDADEPPPDTTGDTVSSLLQTGLLAASLFGGRGGGRKKPGKPGRPAKPKGPKPPKPPKPFKTPTTGRIATKAAREIQNLPSVKLGTMKKSFVQSGKIQKKERALAGQQGPVGIMKTSAKLQKREREIAGELGPVSAIRASAKLAKKEAKAAGVPSLGKQLQSAVESAKVKTKATVQGVGESLQRAKEKAVSTVKATSQGLGIKAQEGVAKIKQVGSQVDKQVQQMKSIATNAQQKATSALQDAQRLLNQSGLQRASSTATLVQPPSLKRASSSATLVNEVTMADRARDFKRLKRDTEIKAIEKLASARRAVNQQIQSVQKVANKKIQQVSGQAGQAVKKAKNDLIVAKRDAELKVIDNLTQTKRNLDQKIKTVSKDLAKTVDKKLTTAKDAGQFVSTVFSSTNPSARRTIREALGVEGPGTFRGVLDKKIKKDLDLKKGVDPTKKLDQRLLARMQASQRRMRANAQKLEKALREKQLKANIRRVPKSEGIMMPGLSRAYNKLKKKPTPPTRLKSVSSLDNKLRPADSVKNLAKKPSVKRSESMSALPNFKNSQIKRSKSLSSLK